MKIRPLADRIVVKRLAQEEKTKGGIIIPDTAKEKPTEGEVMAVGSGKVLEDGTVRKLDVKIGDRVLFGKYNGTEVKLDGEELLIMKEFRHHGHHRRPARREAKGCLSRRLRSADKSRLEIRGRPIHGCEGRTVRW